jgi:hypothetical protein
MAVSSSSINGEIEIEIFNDCASREIFVGELFGGEMEGYRQNSMAANNVAKWPVSDNCICKYMSISVLIGDNWNGTI